MYNKNPLIDPRSKFESLNSKYESDSISNFYTQSSKNLPLSTNQTDRFNNERGTGVSYESDWYASHINIKQTGRKSSRSSRKLCNQKSKEQIASQSKSKSIKRSREDKNHNLKTHREKKNKNSKQKLSSRSKNNQETFHLVQSQILPSYNMRIYMKELQKQNQSYKSTIQILKSQLQQKDTLLDQFQQELTHLKQTFMNFLSLNQKPNELQKLSKQKIKQPIRIQRTQNYGDLEIVETSLQLSCSFKSEIQSSKPILEPKDNFLKKETSKYTQKQQDASLTDSKLIISQQRELQNLLPLKQKLNSTNKIETDSRMNKHPVQPNKNNNSLSAVTSVHRLAHFYTRSKKVN